MKILVVSSYLPFPLFSGGQVRLYNLIKELSSKHEITLICEKRPNQAEKDIEEVKKICKNVYTVDRRRQWSIDNVLRSGISAHSFLITGHTHLEMKQKVEELLQTESFDLIHVETFYVMQNVPQTNIPIVLVEHNIEYKVYEKFLQRAPAILRPLLKMDITKIKKEEESFWARANSLVAVSVDDKKVMEASGFKPAVVSNGVNTEQFSFKNVSKAIEQKEKKVLFIGDFKWIQNQDSAMFIIKEIWPEIESKIDAKLWIVARSIPNSIRSLSNNPTILFDEESSSKPTQEIFQEASVLLAPIRVGGGTSYKILEAMSCGTPVVTMKLSADALEAKDGEQLMVGQSSTELAQKTISLLENKSVYEHVSKKGRAFVEENYKWEEIAKKLDEVYQKT
jgi:glycosyltransferase involved in cell wall biosynthesis